MSAQKPASWAYSEEFVAESDVIERARLRGESLGCVPVLPGAGATLRLLAATASARAVVEIAGRSPARRMPSTPERNGPRKIPASTETR